MEWGRNTYTVLRLPDDVIAALNNPKRVEGELGNHPINLAVTRAPVIEDAFLYTGKTLLEAAGIDPGDVVEARLRAADPAHVEVPADLATALRAAGQTDVWEGLTPGKRRGLIAPIEAAKRPATRVARIGKLIASLQEPA